MLNRLLTHLAAKVGRISLRLWTYSDAPASSMGLRVLETPQQKHAIGRARVGVWVALVPLPWICLWRLLVGWWQTMTDCHWFVRGHQPTSALGFLALSFGH